MAHLVAPAFNNSATASQIGTLGHLIWGFGSVMDVLLGLLDLLSSKAQALCCIEWYIHIHFVRAFQAQWWSRLCCGVMVLSFAFPVESARSSSKVIVIISSTRRSPVKEHQDPSR